MNKRTALAMAATLSVLAAAPPASAADGTIDFIGEVTSNTCIVNAGAPVGPMTVTLPRINASQLTGHGATTAHTRFVIRVSGCGTGATTNARAYFEANGTTVDYVNNALKNLETATDRATGVGFALWNESDRARIQIGQHLNHGTSWIPMTSGGVDLGYEASYIQTTATPVVAGKVRGQVQYSIEYN